MTNAWASAPNVPQSPRLADRGRRWPFRVSELGETFGAEITGVDLVAGVDDELFSRIYEAFLDYQLLVFRGQSLPPDQQVAFGQHFGELQIHVMSQYHADSHPELYALSNLDANGKPSGKHPDRGTMAWHTDGSWRRVTGQATIMYSVEVPASGGETHFCDTYAAYDALSTDDKTRLDSMRAMHNLDFSRNRRHGEEPMTEAQRREVPPVDHPVIRTHPETRRRCLYLGDHAEHIVGMDYAKGRELIDTLNANAVADELRIYRHCWQPNELVVWDNRCLMHRATAYDTATTRRIMRRCTVLGQVPE